MSDINRYPPDRIWMQWHIDQGEATWSKDKINYSDIEYVRFSWITRADAIEAAAKNLINQKGRHNTELAYKQLVAAFNAPVF